MPRSRGFTIERAVLTRPAAAPFLRLLLQVDSHQQLPKPLQVNIRLTGEDCSATFVEDQITPRSVQNDWLVLEIHPQQTPSATLRLCPDEATMEARVGGIVLVLGMGQIRLIKHASGVFHEEGPASGAN